MPTPPPGGIVGSPCRGSRRPPSAASVTSSAVAPTSSPVSCCGRACAADRSAARPGAVARRTRARRPTKRWKCSGLVSGRSRPGRADLERVALAHLARARVTRSHSASVTPSGWSMKTRRRPAGASTSSTSTSGSAGRDASSISVCSWSINSVLTQKKRASAHSRIHSRRRLPAISDRQHESSRASIASATASR